MPGIRTLLVTDREGIVRLSNQAKLIGRDISHREYFLLARRNPDAARLFLSPPYKTVLNVWVMNLTRVIPDEHGRFSGIVAASLDPEYFKILLGSVNYTPDMLTAVAHGDGLQFSMIPEREGMEGKNLARPGSFFSRHQASGQISEVLSGTTYATHEKRMMALHTIKPAALPLDKSLVVAVGRELDAVTRNWRHAALVHGGAFAAAALLSILILAVFQQRQRINFRQIQEADSRQRESAERLKLATEAAGLGVWEYDLISGRLTWDASMFDLYGIEPKAFSATYDAWRNSLLPEDLDRVEKEYNEALNGGKNFDTEFGIRRGNGEVRTIRTIAQFQHDAGRPVRMVGVNEDITERKQSEESLRTAMAEMKIVNRLMQGREARLVELKSEVNFLSTKLGLATPYGTLSEYDLPELEEVNTELSGLEQAVERSLIQNIMDAFCDAIGVASGIFGLNGRIIVRSRWTGICTNFHRANERSCLNCIESDTMSANQFNKGEGSTIYTCKNGMTVAASPILVNGRHIANIVIGQFFLVPPDEDFFSKQADEYGFDKTAYLEALREVTVLPEFRLAPALKFITSLAELTASISNDKTQRDETERHFKIQQKNIISIAEDANRASLAKSEFLANMSHEIRTPMNAVIGLTHLMMSTELTSRQKDYLHKIHSSSNALLTILNDILDYSKIEAGRLSLE
ncbi:MAG: PocR ligand-binding domain-containing protein, partial [Deltaproteobacteria bacterium]|nr:PocR ligand-binding domain-containing protein [Deltaproteobacteria bacterium]